ncbi:MAG: Lrp/AsnC family transcriptional regulator [Schaedlerella sp.]|nr:Lrp/AsnC family transcriptional regulator [Schaedlerella sp.]
MRNQILRYLERNSRIDLEELAILLGMDKIGLINEIEKMERERIICGYHTMVNWEKAGEEKVTALIEVRVTPQRGEGFERIAERIYNYPEVTSVYLISGAYDFLVTLEGRTLMEISRFVSEKLSPIDDVISTSTHFILKKYKDHGTIMGSKKGSERMLVTP